MNTNHHCRSAIPVPAVLAVLAGALVGACATESSGSADSADPAEMVSQSSGSISAETVYKPAPWKKTYSEGRRVIRREARQVGDSPNKWIIDEFDSPDGTLRGGLVRQTTLERGADGSVFLVELGLVLENRSLAFDPPLVLMPATLTGEKACISTSDVTMKDGDSAAATKTRGTATQTTKLVRQSGDSTVIRSQMEAKFDFSTVDRTAVLTVVPGRGIVREVQDRSVRFGLFNLSRTTSTVTLVEQVDQ
ncbi:MAG: hypothetical protein KF691_15715 [Phycisphaeraceae bacterium]|nr:hypothetical protein [Phycisphaeraceae bacterium]